MLGFLWALNFLRSLFRNRLRLWSRCNPHFAPLRPLYSLRPLNMSHRSLNLLRWSLNLSHRSLNLLHWSLNLPHWSFNLSHRGLHLSLARLWRSYLTLVLPLLLLLLNLLTAPRCLLSRLLLGRLLISYPARLILTPSVFDLLAPRGFGLRLLLQSHLPFLSLLKRLSSLNGCFLFSALLYLLVL